MTFVNKLFGVLGDSDVGTYAAKGIGEISGSDDTLTKQNHAIVKVGALLLHRLMNYLKPCGF